MQLPIILAVDFQLILLGFIIAFLIALVLIVGKFFNLWLRARVAGAPVGILDLIFMWLRRVPNALIVDTRITASKAGIDISTDELEAHYLAGGEVSHVVLALIAAAKAGIKLDYDRACAIDLAVKGTGKTVLEAVRTSINPKVIDCPNPASGKDKIDAVARDGIAVRARARVTVRTNLAQLIGGATEDTIIARVGEGIITSIGSAEGHLEVMENPDRISKAVLARGLDAHTAFEIVSIDIADIDIGENIGARLQADQAEADTRKAQALAEKRRANAVAHEQEMKASVAENRAAVFLAQAEVPRAMAQAFREGNLETTGRNGV
jgi:uncharacterized protein YqfA (UPF0365 family)